MTKFCSWSSGLSSLEKDKGTINEKASDGHISHSYEWSAMKTIARGLSSRDANIHYNCTIYSSFCR